MSTLYINLCFHLCLFSLDTKKCNCSITEEELLNDLINITKLLLIGTIPTQYHQQYIN